MLDADEVDELAAADAATKLPPPATEGAAGTALWAAVKYASMVSLDLPIV